MPAQETVRVAALADIHVSEQNRHSLRDLFGSIAHDADLLVLAGDLTNRGQPAEAEMLAEEMRSLSLPVVGVLGNHDFESGHAEEVRQILCQSGLLLLEDEPHEVCGIGFAGTVGFCGGFDGHMLAPFGEEAIKQFVHVTVDEALRLESALSRLSAERKVAVLHYAPVRDTVVGESPEIFAFLGCSRLCDPVDRFNVHAVFHGHAHHGTHAGKSPGGVPVYNVAHSIMESIDPERPYLVLHM